MFLIKKILIILFLLFPISNSFAGMVTFVQTTQFTDSNDVIQGIEFNKDGTKMFASYGGNATGESTKALNEYNLTTPFDISTRVYAGDDERCVLSGPEFSLLGLYDLEFSSDGMKLFLAQGSNTKNSGARSRVDIVFRFDLTSPFDISTCSFAHETPLLETDALQNNSEAGSVTIADGTSNDNRLQGMEINDDGTKLFLIFHGANATHSPNTRLLEYQLSTPYDLTTISLNTNAGIELEDEVSNPNTMRFSANGKRLFLVDHNNAASGKDVTQISLNVAYDTSSYTIDGRVYLPDLDSALDQPRGISFSANGLKMYVGDDDNDDITEFDLVCPFNIISGNCPSITENSDKTGMAEAQIELARRTIERSTNSTLNRLKWIRRNKDKQNLTNLNINLNFSNQILASLTEVVRTSASKKNTKDKKQDVFYWSEGSIAVGRMGDTSVSSSKEIETNSLTLGADKFTENNGIVGLAFRYGRDNTDVGDAGSNLDADTYNLTFYNTRPSEIDTKYIDTIIGIGKIKTDILSVMDGEHVTANRRGKQMYGTVKIKDEIKKNKLTIIPSSQIDFGHTILNAYDEVGLGAISVEKQHVKTRHLRATVAAVHDLENERYSIKRHGKLEYQANLKRSSNLKYTYVSDTSKAFNTKLNPAAFHNINGEIGIDIVFPENYSIFIIYERNQALDYGHTDNIHIALGYLPNKDTEYAFKINGSENLMSKFEIKKDINGFNLSLNLNDDLTNIGNAREANIELNKVF
mgnify:FL=1